nr:HycuOrf-141 hypothetical protein [Hyphantria cunea nucleopolyhedrovirus]UIX56412.1 HycuOrf-141 hypothetical protein [Hyphantria cunea nucleopolyhedrovirus]
MSLSSKLLVYAFYGVYNAVHKNYGESYHLYRLANEYITNVYVCGASCVRRDIATARCLNHGGISFDDARQLLEIGEVAACLSAWYRCGDTTGLCTDLQRALAVIDCFVPLAKRVARSDTNIYALDAFVADIPNDVVDSLQSIIGRFIHFARCSELEHVAEVFDPTIKADGWWYHKFCVLTYMAQMIAGSVPAELTMRLQNSVTKYIRPNDEGNCAPAMASVYGRFCGIGRDHFEHHKMTSTYLLFQYMRGEPASNYPGYIKDFGRHCKSTYGDVGKHADTLYINATSDRKKNMLFDLLCCVNAADIDADCYDYIVTKFYENFVNKNKMY